MIQTLVCYEEHGLEVRVQQLSPDQHKLLWNAGPLA